MYLLLLSGKLFKIKSGASGPKSVNDMAQLFDACCQVTT